MTTDYSYYCFARRYLGKNYSRVTVPLRRLARLAAAPRMGKLLWIVY
jgi:hypothetical protein